LCKKTTPPSPSSGIRTPRKGGSRGGKKQDQRRRNHKVKIERGNRTILIIWWALENIIWKLVKRGRRVGERGGKGYQGVRGKRFVKYGNYPLKTRRPNTKHGGRVKEEKEGLVENLCHLVEGGTIYMGSRGFGPQGCKGKEKRGKKGIHEKEVRIGGDDSLGGERAIP